MTAALTDQFALTVEQLRAAALRVGVVDFPIVLAVRSAHATIGGREAGLAAATRELVSANLIVDGVVHPDLVAILQGLARPDRELAMRLVTPQGMARVAVMRCGQLCVLARRVGDDVLLRIIGQSVELRSVASVLMAELPRCRPADITPVGAPLHEIVDSLCGTHDATGLADRVRALGAEPRAAMLLGTALASRQAFAEIVYYRLSAGEGRIWRGPGATAVFYTGRGRIIGVPSVSPSGQLWTTLKAGSDHALGQAIGQLVEISNQRWENS
ncbi:ESX secretion-associated protein EspG [Mycobacterium sp. AZCC_0083]|uniref:ESX secretion-associated protein EspG n=1 Tax=Mycobacterium sp. AZCC_0083 TaxID=2735882 RepID=UPI00161483C5|nr:ESX secretion-associated protein EspG [Mycobacterium sp. AZCC_0083]MBB5167581.1 hypothetical protein [Mycobacterium sp. AZCC_0083]